MTEENLDSNQEIITDIEPKFEPLKPGEVGSFGHNYLTYH